MPTKIFNYVCPECKQKVCSISEKPEKMICECGAECDSIGTEEDRQHAKPDIDHIDFKSNPKEECLLKGKKCAILNQTDDICVVELESAKVRNMSNDQIEIIRKFSVKPCGSDDSVEPVIYEEVID